jgi:hypothetical protein
VPEYKITTSIPLAKCNGEFFCLSSPSWEREQEERRTIYRDDLYKFIGDEIVVAELTGSQPIGHAYKDSWYDTGCDDEKEMEAGERT